MKHKKPKDPEKERIREEKRKQRELRKFTQKLTGFSRIGRNNV